MKIGDRVIRVGEKHENSHEANPEFYPKLGTIGEVLDIRPTRFGIKAYIQWAFGSTSDDDCWWEYPDNLSVTK